MLETQRIADQLDRSFRGGAWHGPSVSEVLEGVDAEVASAHPVAGAHSIWEIVQHLTVWNDVPRKRIQGEPIEQVASADDWCPVEDASREAWRKTLASLDESHRLLHERILKLDDGRLDAPVAGSDPTVRGLLLGVIQHNAYHAGQILMLRKAMNRVEHTT